MLGIVALAAAISNATPVVDDHRLSSQAMTSPAYEAFARQADAMCPSRKLRYLHPADFGYLEEVFLMSLSADAQSRVAAVNKGWDGCPPAGASCPAQHALGAIIEVGMIEQFTLSACSTALPREVEHRDLGEQIR